MADAKRIVVLHPGGSRSRGEFVLYWSQIQRRSTDNDALNFAVEQANTLGLPVLFYEGLRHDYPHASDRLHTFVLENARELSADLAARGIRHAFYLERDARSRRPIVRELVRRAACVVTDWYPAFIIPGHNRALARIAAELDVPAVAVDGCGVIPVAEFPKREFAARTLRPKLHKLLPFYLHTEPDPQVLHGGAHLEVEFDEEDWRAPISQRVASCDIDHRVSPVSEFHPGGRTAALARVQGFLDTGLDRYETEGREPLGGATSQLSPYLHFGMIGAREVALTVQGARPAAHPAVAAFLEQLLVRRELAINFCAREPKHRSLSCLPEWARRTLAAHADDIRDPSYTRKQLEASRTHDDLWNACQTDLRLTGTIPNYLRMLWGKKIIEWSPTHDQALQRMIYLNDRYALDGRDPNSYTSFLWCFGLHDRPWGERPIIGTTRSMSSALTAKKLDATAYLARMSALQTEREEIRPS